MRTPSKGSHVAGKRPLAMSNFFPKIRRCKISNVLKRPKKKYLWRKLRNLKGKGKLIFPKNGRHYRYMAKLNPNCNLVFLFSMVKQFLASKVTWLWCKKTWCVTWVQNWTWIIALVLIFQPSSSNFWYWKLFSNGVQNAKLHLGSKIRLEL